MSVEFESETVSTDEMTEDEAMHVIQNPEHFISANEQFPPIQISQIYCYMLERYNATED